MKTTKIFCKITAMILLLQMCFSLASCDALQILEDLAGRGDVEDTATPDGNNGQEELILPDEVFCSNDKFTIERKNGKCYINYVGGNGEQHTGDYYLSGDYMHSPYIRFRNADEMKTAIKNGKLKSEITIKFHFALDPVAQKMFPRDENGIFLPDPDKIRLPILPEDTKITSVIMYGDSYSYEINASENISDTIIGLASENEIQEKLDAFINYEEIITSGTKNPINYIDRQGASTVNFSRRSDFQLHSVEKSEDGMTGIYKYSFERDGDIYECTAETRIVRNGKDVVCILEEYQEMTVKHDNKIRKKQSVMCFGMINGDYIHSIYNYKYKTNYTNIDGTLVPDEIVEQSLDFEDEYWLTLGFEK